MKNRYKAMIAAAAFALASVPAIWECRQPDLQYRTNVEHINKVRYCSNFQGFCSISYYVDLDGVPGTVRFSSAVWDKTVKEGDTVDVVVRRNFLGCVQSDFAGKSIDDSK